MRLVLTTNFSPWSTYSGGGQRSTHQLASALVSRGHHVTVVYTKGALDRIDAPKNLPYDVVWAPFFGLRSSRQAPLRPLNAISVRNAVRKIAETSGLDAVHCQGEEGALLDGLRDTYDFRLIVTPRYPWYPKRLRPNRNLLDQARLWLFDAKYPVLGRLIRAADRICPTSRSAAEGIEEAYGVSSNRIEVIPNGINPVFWSKDWAQNLADGDVLFFGRLAKDKGVDVLLKAMDSVPRTLHIVGRGDEEASLRQYAAKLGIDSRVKWTSWCVPEDLVDLIASASVIALPSLHESFGNVMAETLAMGAPLVSTHTGSIPEVSGESAWLVPPNDADALATTINRVLDGDDESRTRAKSGQAHVRNMFHWDAVAAQFERVYSSVSVQ